MFRSDLDARNDFQRRSDRSCRFSGEEKSGKRVVVRDRDGAESPRRRPLHDLFRRKRAVAVPRMQMQIGPVRFGTRLGDLTAKVKKRFASGHGAPAAGPDTEFVIHERDCARSVHSRRRVATRVMAQFGQGGESRTATLQGRPNQPRVDQNPDAIRARYTRPAAPDMTGGCRAAGSRPRAAPCRAYDRLRYHRSCKSPPCRGWTYTRDPRTALSGPRWGSGP